MATAMHYFIDKYNVLKRPTQQVQQYLVHHKTLYKTALVVNHLFRAVMMSAMLSICAFPMVVSASLCFAASLFYRLTVENNCAYKFALPACCGGIALWMGRKGLQEMISKVAFVSLSSFSKAAASLIPLVGYLIYIILTVSYDVNVKCKS